MLQYHTLLLSLLASFFISGNNPTTHQTPVENLLTVHVIDMITSKDIANASVVLQGKLLGYTESTGLLQRSIPQSAPAVVEIISGKEFYINSRSRITLKPGETEAVIRLFNTREIKKMQKMLAESNKKINTDLIDQLNNIKSAYPDFEFMEEFQDLREIEAELQKYEDQLKMKKKNKGNPKIEESEINIDGN